MDELAREYGRTPPADPRRAEIAKQLSELCLMLLQSNAASDKARGPPYAVTKEEIEQFMDELAQEYGRTSARARRSSTNYLRYVGALIGC